MLIGFKHSIDPLQLLCIVNIIMLVTCADKFVKVIYIHSMSCFTNWCLSFLYSINKISVIF